MISRTKLAVLAGVSAGIAAVIVGALPAQAVQAGSSVQQVEPCVQRVAVVNNAAFVMSFLVTTRTGTPTPATDEYAVNQWRVIDLTTTDVPEGTDVRPLVSANSGGTQAGNRFVSFCANGQTATYSVTGTTNDFTVTLIT